MGFILCGHRDRIEAEIKAFPRLAAASRIVHTDTAISMADKPSQAVRRGRGSSMWHALDQVKQGAAQAALSAGNTGALMAMSKLVLRPMADIERPAIAAFWPTIKGECIVLDVGANIGATARQLAEYALMGAAMARAHFKIERPSVGLLNVGVEEIKGVDEVKQAHAWLKLPELGLPIDYRGFVEGDQIGQGIVDVVVVEGFAGNIALKTAEGTARQIGVYLREAMGQSLGTKIGAMLARPGFRTLKHKMDPRRVNGAVFLGLDGIAVKSHGGTDAFGFASAINVSYEMAAGDLKGRIASDLGAFHGKLDAIPAN
jgi:glycerol-3-phosphate acyltransferase PlsX